jgi:peptidoglycan/xylan/chitin deacetylase (PgdA/CDA1 family)
MKAVMYHYVRPEPVELPYLRYLHIDDFRRQLDHFAATDRFIGRDELLAILDGAPVPADGILLTFDDGLSDHHDHVLPELVARDAVGLFYVPTGPHATGTLLNVHRVHHLLGRHGGAHMMSELEPLLADSSLEFEGRAGFRSGTYREQDNDEATATFKRTLNYFAGTRQQDGLLDRLVAAHLDDEADLVTSFYASSDQLRAIHAAGMLIGSHTITHPVMSKLDRAAQAREISDSIEALEDVLGPLEPRHYCHPYGGFHSFDGHTEELLAEVGCRFAFNIESRDIVEADLRERPYALPRYDCNEFPHGAARGIGGAPPAVTGLT